MKQNTSSDPLWDLTPERRQIGLMSIINRERRQERVRRSGPLYHSLREAAREYGDCPHRVTKPGSTDDLFLSGRVSVP
jgi:hypothetical protein